MVLLESARRADLEEFGVLSFSGAAHNRRPWLSYSRVVCAKEVSGSLVFPLLKGENTVPYSRSRHNARLRTECFIRRGSKCLQVRDNRWDGGAQHLTPCPRFVGPFLIEFFQVTFMPAIRWPLPYRVLPGHLHYGGPQKSRPVAAGRGRRVSVLFSH